MLRRPQDACGVFGICNAKTSAAPLTFLGLHALQHRGQESAGLVTLHSGSFHSHKGMGLVANVFAESASQKLPGHSAIGHVRYSLAGQNSFLNTQPLLASYKEHYIAVAHNGCFAFADKIRNELIRQGALFQTTSDTELLLHLLAQDQATTNEQIAKTLATVGPAFALVMLIDDNRLIAARDPWGYRPLVLGSLNGAYVVASETCAFDQIDADYIRDIEPGEMLVIDDTGCHSYDFGKETKKTCQCLLELIYFGRPDSVIFGETPHIMRERSGAVLAKEHPADADIAVAIPDSGMSAAMGFATALGIPFERGLIRNHYVGRSFILPGAEARATAVRMKHNIVREIVKGKRVALIDDSLIRGTTTRSLSKALRDAGATEVHLRIACPPTIHSCPYGINFPKREDLMAYQYSIEEMRERLDVDSIGFLSLKGLTGLFGDKGNNFCTACWSGKYEPTELY